MGHVCEGKTFQQEGTRNVKTLRQNVPRADIAYEIKIGVRMTPWVLA